MYWWKCLLCLGLMVVIGGFGVGCSDSDGDGGGAATILPANDGQFSGFLWKPRSESNGRLVVLLPAEFTGNVTSGDLHTSNNASIGNLVEAGLFVGDTHNGNRAHYRFKNPGGAYGQVWFVATLGDGSRRAWFIENGAQRWD